VLLGARSIAGQARAGREQGLGSQGSSSGEGSDGEGEFEAAESEAEGQLAEEEVKLERAAAVAVQGGGNSAEQAAAFDSAWLEQAGREGLLGALVALGGLLALSIALPVLGVLQLSQLSWLRDCL
jgi:hypothetical protein